MIINAKTNYDHITSTFFIIIPVANGYNVSLQYILHPFVKLISSAV